MPNPVPRILPAVLGLLLAGLLSACATIPVRVDYDEGTEFLFYTSFAVAKDGGKPRRVESLNDARVHRAIVEGLEAKGLAEAPRAEADLLVRWHTRFRRRTVVTDVYPSPFWRPRRMDVYHIREGVLTIELIDRAQGRVVWEGSATGVVDDPERNRETVRRAVRAILDKYPPMH
jgi:hypothetical protein